MLACLFIRRRSSLFFLFFSSLRSQRNWTCNGSWHHSLFAFLSSFFSLPVCYSTVCYVCNLCMKFISILMYSGNPTTDDSRQYYIKLLLRFCTPFPYPLHSVCTLFVVVLLFHRNEDKLKRSVSGTEAIESIHEATNGQFKLEVAFTTH